MSVVATHQTGDRLGSYALFGAILASAGLPIYLFAPKFFADSYGVSLATLGAVLFGLRLFDVVQDPLLGWVAERTTRIRGLTGILGGALLAASMVALFAVAPPIAPILWFSLALIGLFSAFSFLSINFYAQGVTKADEITGGHVRLAAWREGGALLGVCIAAVLPTAFATLTNMPFTAFAYVYAAVVLLAVIAMMPEWRPSPVATEPTSISEILGDNVARRLLILALVNATPLAVSSTLFLFFVESRLVAPGWEGPLLVVFFVAAAASAPVWARIAQKIGTKRTLLIAMLLAIASFSGVFALGPGDVVLFAVVCLATGATIGADLTLLPAMFSRRMAAISPSGAQGFGLWSLVTKFTLAFAAGVLLPALDLVGFQSGSANNPENVLQTLTWLYAGLPIALKFIAIALLVAIPLEENA